MTPPDREQEHRRPRAAGGEQADQGRPSDTADVVDDGVDAERPRCPRRGDQLPEPAAEATRDRRSHRPCRDEQHEDQAGRNAAHSRGGEPQAYREAAEEQPERPGRACGAVDRPADQRGRRDLGHEQGGDEGASEGGGTGPFDRQQDKTHAGTLVGRARQPGADDVPPHVDHLLDR